MSEAIDTGREPAKHYDTVVEAWGHLLEEDLHYGYFETGSESLPDATDALTNQMLQLAKPEKGQHVLDVGCGTGKAACRIGAEFGAHVTGISPSQVCVANANNKATSLSLDSLVQFRIGDGTKPDFPDASFDIAWVMESSHLMPDKPALIRECARLLKPGGRIVLCDVMLDHKLPLDEMLSYRDDFLLLKDVFGRARMEPLEFYQEQCEANGLVAETARDISLETQPTFQHWGNNAERNRSTVVEMIGAEACQQFADSCTVLDRFWDLNILGYGIISATKPA